jgi:NCAIR mutase (PurE)-related protein
MKREEILKIFRDIQKRRITPEDAFRLFQHLPYEDLKIAKIDHHRQILSGIPEVIFAKDKKPDDVVAIARNIYKRHGKFLITKANVDIYRKLKLKTARYYEKSCCIVAGGAEEKKGNILILTAGTSDIGIAEEACLTAEFLGSKVEMEHDLGIAGLHRVIDYMDRFKKARVIIVIAGMEGALPSVVGALTDKPVIGVPTSTGYGTSLGGISALLGMLNSCVPGIAVMNIDNGFGAACLAHRINMLDKEFPKTIK